jgi:hypothetical protein
MVLFKRGEGEGKRRDGTGKRGVFMEGMGTLINWGLLGRVDDYGDSGVLLLARS